MKTLTAFADQGTGGGFASSSDGGVFQKQACRVFGGPRKRVSSSVGFAGVFTKSSGYEKQTDPDFSLLFQMLTYSRVNS